MSEENEIVLYKKTYQNLLLYIYINQDASERVNMCVSGWVRERERVCVCVCKEVRAREKSREL